MVKCVLRECRIVKIQFLLLEYLRMMIYKRKGKEEETSIWRVLIFFV